ncbi:MAG: FliA/WhiG family RNA polymerase sigma factor [Proteobacteria bacterium]|nr:FliA/WhiG family RNA polymerase sigma factor [Pseudomonadota bacterium]MBU1581188.1 FliA/WhiG family RNA polymerase sigma factor [Pseudomonadota bacterium]MBU2453905.1 FliA/WhiG family RNA polymerase sigma factor [Pseudomonadota bacterium]MBU2628090.1 FliA/WhiG family RNA polymerase sigma factor [Pseudomonadota bacterium]
MKNKQKEKKTGKDSWRENSIIEYAYLVKHIASRFAMRLPSSVFFDELVSAGSLGLIDAVDKFDASKHVSLKTYAQYRIKGAILDELRSMDTYSRSMRKKIQDITKAVKSIEDHKGSPATDIEICGELGVSLEAYYDMLTNIHGASVLSLDEFIKTKKNDSYSQTRFESGIKGRDNPADCFDREELKFVLAQGIKILSEKEQMVVSLYYYDELTLKEIGEVLTLTESRICQIHTAILVKLKARLQDYFN